jgi:electron transfer flavoprotein alpha subunit
LALAPYLADAGVVVLPATPDGRDLGPRLAAALGWPLLAGAVRVTEQGALLVRHQGRQVARFEVTGRFVATLLAGGRSAYGHEYGGTASAIAAAPHGGDVMVVTELEAPPPADASPPDPEVVGVLEADPSAMDLAEADRILAAGAGLGGAGEIALLQRVAAQLHASVGATRVVTDAGLLPHERQIGTTGASVQPRCYVALGISGAAQHVGGLGNPRHVIAVNTDPSCPMMATADLALVTDAKACLEAVARRLAAMATPDPAAGASNGEAASGGDGSTETVEESSAATDGRSPVTTDD